MPGAQGEDTAPASRPVCGLASVSCLTCLTPPPARCPLPAKATLTFSVVMSVSASWRFWVKMMLKTAWERLLVSFMFVAATVLGEQKPHVVTCHPVVRCEGHWWSPLVGPGHGASAPEALGAALLVGVVPPVSRQGPHPPVPHIYRRTLAPNSSLHSGCRDWGCVSVPRGSAEPGCRSLHQLCRSPRGCGVRRQRPWGTVPPEAPCLTVHSPRWGLEDLVRTAPPQDHKRSTGWPWLIQGALATWESRGAGRGSVAMATRAAPPGQGGPGQ